MSHHGNDPERAAAMSEMMKGLMGEYPNGRLNENDAGAVAMAVSSEGAVVRLDFPKPMMWVGFTGDQAMQLAQDLMKHARRAGITAPVVIRIGE